MAYTSHLVARFMAAGAEQCLDDYHFIRNTHDTVHDQEAQLNRILRMLNEDDIHLNWHIDTTPIGRSRSQTRSYKFDRACLPGNIAYLRLREREQEELKKRSSSNFAPPRTYERRRRISEQGNHPPLPNSFARQRVSAEYATSRPGERYQEEKSIVNDEKYRKEKPVIRDGKYQREKPVTDTKKQHKEKLAILEEKYQKAKSILDDQKFQVQKPVTDIKKYARATPVVNDVKYSAEKATVDEQKQHIQKSTADVGHGHKAKLATHDELYQKQNPVSDVEKHSGAKLVANDDKHPVAKSAIDEQKPVVDVGKHHKEKPTVDDRKYSGPKPIVSDDKHLTEKPDIVEQESHTQKPVVDDGKHQQEKLAAQEEKRPKQKSTVDTQKSQIQKPPVDADQSPLEKHAVHGDKHPTEKSVIDEQKQQNMDVSKHAEESAVVNQKIHLIEESIVVDDEDYQEETSILNDEQREPARKDTEEGFRKAKTSHVQAAGSKQDDEADDDSVKSQENNLASFVIRYEECSSSNQNSDDQDPLGYVVCEWTSPDSSASALKYYTIERQFGDQQWLPVEEKIEKTTNQVEFDLSSLLANGNEESGSSRFRLKAHLKDGKTWTSKPTDQINLDLLASNRFITPDVEVLTADSVQLTWKNDDSKKTGLYDIEKKDTPQGPWTKVSKVALSQGSASVDNLVDAEQCQFRLVPSKTDADNESDVLTVQNVNEWLSSLRLEPVSANIVDIDISDEGFKEFDQYKVEYAAIDQPDQWKQVSNITRDAPHLTVDKLTAGVDYKFRLTPIQRGATAVNDATSSHLSLVLDVKMPLTRKGRLVKNEVKKTAPPTQFAIHQTDPTTVFIEAIVPTDKPALFEDVFEVYSKKETADDDWVKVGTIDKDHLSMTIKNLSENTAYTFKIHNQTTPSSDEQNNIVQEFNFETASVKLYDPSIFLEKVQRNLENVVNGVMKAAAGHQTLEESVNTSLSDVIRKIFLDENLVPNEQYGFDTLALSDDLQLFRGPKQMLLQELEVNETNESIKNEGEIIIHNHRQLDRDQQPVIVREENGNTRIGNIDGDVIIRNVVTDVLLSNEEKRNQLSMNIVGQAFLKRVQGTLIASNFKGIIVVKNVDKP